MEKFELSFINKDPNEEADDGDITFFDKDGNPIRRYGAPSWEGLTEDQIFSLPCWKDPIKARELFEKLKKLETKERRN